MTILSLLHIITCKWSPTAILYFFLIFFLFRSCHIDVLMHLYLLLLNRHNYLSNCVSSTLYLLLVHSRYFRLLFHLNFRVLIQQKWPYKTYIYYHVVFKNIIHVMVSVKFKHNGLTKIWKMLLLITHKNIIRISWCWPQNYTSGSFRPIQASNWIWVLDELDYIGFW